MERVELKERERKIKEKNNESVGGGSVKQIILAQDIRGIKGYEMQ